MIDVKKEMKSVVFLIPYFGKFNNYFPIFLQSCKYNPSINWIIFTDDKSSYDYPENVQVEYTTLRNFNNLANKKMNSNFTISRSYKLCDYKPAYGLILEDFIKNYDWWGYCDMDLVWGDIRKFFIPELLENYDKIGVYGHCTIIKNTDALNRAFLSDLDGHKRYLEVFNSEENRSFDEEFNGSINNIFKSHNYRIHDTKASASVYPKSSNFRLTWLKNKHDYFVEKRSKSFFLWDKGKLTRYIFKSQNVRAQEFLYLHLQSRKMRVSPQLNIDCFKIIPNSFDYYNTKLDPIVDIKKIKLKHFNLHYFSLRSKNLIIKTKKRFGLNG